MTIKLAKSWHNKLEDEIKKPYVQELKAFIQKEKEAGYTIYPPLPSIFNAFSHTSFDEVKVVIMGQDPYHGAHQAHGLSFSVQKGIPIPPSLKNIYKELKNDLDIPEATHGCLESWAKQGVLLLNATLTVRAGNPRSHYGMGWESFTDKVIEKLCEREDPLVFLLWGKSAKEKCENILNLKKHPHVILTAAHPSPYSATGFLGCRHFSKTNEYLEKWGKKVINWRIDP